MAIKHPPNPLATEKLKKKALSYLERFSASTHSLRRVLDRHVVRSSHQHGTSLEEGRQALEMLLLDLQKTGLLNDQAYAEAKIESLMHAGRTQHFIRLKLAEKGVDGALVDRLMKQAVQSLSDALSHIEDPDIVAAMRYARRRRIGPWRKNPKQGDSSQRIREKKRDMAALARQGFSYNIVCQVLESSHDPLDMDIDDTP